MVKIVHRVCITSCVHDFKYFILKGILHFYLQRVELFVLYNPRNTTPFPLPIHKTLPKTVFGPCLQSELESRSQGKSTFVKKIGGLLLRNIYQVPKTTKIPIWKNKKTYI